MSCSSKDCLPCIGRGKRDGDLRGQSSSKPAAWSMQGLATTRGLQSRCCSQKENVEHNAERHANRQDRQGRGNNLQHWGLLPPSALPCQRKKCCNLRFGDVVPAWKIRPSLHLAQSCCQCRSQAAASKIHRRPDLSSSVFPLAEKAALVRVNTSLTSCRNSCRIRQE